MKFGIVGTNFVSDYFMSGAREVIDCEVVAVCSKNSENAVRFAKKYGISNVFDTYEQMCASGLIEAVYIATPNSTHKEIATYFMSHGIHALCEKPMASNIGEVREMVECARKNRVYLHEGIVPVFSKNFDTVKENLHRVGKIRQVYMIMSQYSTRYDAYLRGENPTTFRSELSNGAIMDLGIYPFALTVALFGMPVGIHSTANLLESGADVAGASILTYDTFCAMLAYSKASGTENKIEIAGECGTLIIAHATTYKSIIFVDRKTGMRTELYSDTGAFFAPEIREMIKDINSGKTESQRLPLDLSLKIHELITESRRIAGIIFPADLKQ